jgi:hypothetical protein
MSFKPQNLRKAGTLCNWISKIKNKYKNIIDSNFQEVGTSVLYIVMHGNKDKEALKKVLTPLLSKLNPSAWSVLNKNMVWSQKRPVWLQVCCAIITHCWTLFDKLI